MRKLCFLLLFPFAVLSQTVTYTPSESVFNNPERGFYLHESTSASNYDPLSASSLIDHRNQGKTLVLRIFYLDNFINSPISSSFISSMQADFNAMRQAGVKCIVRVAYSESSAPYDATKPVLLNHIQQLKTVFLNNRDVIACFQAGMIAKYGEWWQSTNYGTGTLTQQNVLDRKEIAQAIMTNWGIPCKRFIQFRTPLIAQGFLGTQTPVSLTQAYTLTNIGLTALHNDAFLNGTDEDGTYIGNASAVQAQRTYAQAVGKYGPIGGEANEHPTPQTPCSSAIENMKNYSYDYFNSVGYAEDLIANWNSGGCLAEMKNRLGYRFQFVSTVVNPQQVSIKLKNVGFGHVFNERKVYLVYRNTTTQAETQVEINTDCRLWLKDTDILLTSLVPAGLPQGQYRLFLNMPDPLLPNNTNYSIRFANENVWDTTKGYNDLLTTISITSLGVPEVPVTQVKAYVQYGKLIIDGDFKRFVLYNMRGQRVKSGNQSGIDVSDLSKAVYLLRIDNLKSIRLMVE